MLTTLIGPLLFAAFGGVWGYLKHPERRHGLLATLICFQLLGAYCSLKEPSAGLFALLCGLGLIVFSMLLHTLLRPLPLHQRGR